MKLYLITQSKETGYDTFDSAVVAAKDEATAKTIHPGGQDSWGDVCRSWCKTPEAVVAELIGTAVKGTKQGLILASFNAS